MYNIAGIDKYPISVQFMGVLICCRQKSVESPLLINLWQF